MKSLTWLHLATTSLLVAQVSAQDDLLGTLVSIGFSVYTEATSLLTSAASAASVASVASALGSTRTPASTRASTTGSSSTSRTSSSSSSTSSGSSSTSSSSASDAAASVSESAASLASAASSASAAAASATGATGAGNNSGGGGTNKLAIILGSVLGALALGLLLLALLLCCRRRRRGRRSLRSTSPTDGEVGAWTGKHANAGPPIVHNKTEVEVNAPPPGNGLPMSQHPGTANGMMTSANPFVPIPPAPRRSAPNARPGLTDGAVPGDDPYLMEKGTNRPLTPGRHHDNSHKGSALAAGAGGAALGAAAMHHHNNNKVAEPGVVDHGHNVPLAGHPVSGGHHTGPGVGPGQGVGPGIGHGVGHGVGPGIGNGTGPGTGLAAHGGHHPGPGAAALGGTALGAAAMHNHNKHHNGDIVDEKFHTPPMMPGSHNNTPIPLNQHQQSLPGAALLQTGQALPDTSHANLPGNAQGRHGLTNPALAGAGGAALGAAAMHHHNKNHERPLVGGQPRAIPLSQGTTLAGTPHPHSSRSVGEPVSTGSALPTGAALPTAGALSQGEPHIGTSVNPMRPHGPTHDEALLGVGGAALGAGAMHQMHHRGNSFIDENRHDSLFANPPANNLFGPVPHGSAPTNVAARQPPFTGGQPPLSSYSHNTSTSAGPALGAGAMGAALGAAATHHHDAKNNLPASKIQNQPSNLLAPGHQGIIGRSTPTTSAVPNPGPLGRDGLSSVQPSLDQGAGPRRSYDIPHRDLLGAGAAGTALGAAAAKHHNNSNIKSGGNEIHQPTPIVPVLANPTMPVSSGTTSTVPTQTLTSPSTGISTATERSLTSPGTSSLPSHNSYKSEALMAGAVSPALAGANTHQNTQPQLMNTNVSDALKPSPLQPARQAPGSMLSGQPKILGASDNSRPNIPATESASRAPASLQNPSEPSHHSKALATGLGGAALGAAVASRDEHLARDNLSEPAVAPFRQDIGPDIHSQPLGGSTVPPLAAAAAIPANIPDERRQSLRSVADSSMSRKPLPAPVQTATPPAPMPTTTSNDDAFALNKTPGRRSGESARRSLSRDADRANAVFDNEYSQRPVSSHGATAAAAAAAASLAGGSAAAHRRPNSHSRSPHRRLLLRHKERSSDTSSSSNDYTDALPGPNPFSPMNVQRSQHGAPLTGPASGSGNVLPTDIPPAPVTRSRRNSALGTAAPPAAVFAYQNRNRSHSRSRSTSSDNDQPPLPNRSPKRNSFPNVPFVPDMMPLETPLRYAGRDNEAFMRDAALPNVPSYPPNATPYMPADPNEPLLSTAHKSLVGDNGYPHMNVPRRKSGGAYDFEKHGPFGPQSVSPPLDKSSGDTSDDSSWRLSSGMPGGWRRMEGGRTGSLTSSVRGSGVAGIGSPLGLNPPADYNDPLADRDVARDSGISGISSGASGKRLRATDIRGDRRSEEINRSGADFETPEEIMARGRHSVEREWTGNGGYDGYAYYHPDDMQVHSVGTAM